MSFEDEIRDNGDIYSQLEGTLHQARILTSTKGALIVSLTIKSTVFKGVLLEVTENLHPSVVTLPESQDIDEERDLEQRTAYLAFAEANGENIGSSSQYRYTYHSQSHEETSQKVIPQRSIHRIHEHKRLRYRHYIKPKLILCSMCKTHCLNTDDSDKESIKQQQTPSLKISYKAPDGHSVMDIVPKKLKKRKHHSKHKKDKKHKSSHHRSEKRKPHVKEESVVSEENNSLDKKLVINLTKLPPASTVVVNDHKHETKHQPSSQTADNDKESSIVSERKTRSVTTYLNNDGKQISVGDVVWGKIVGFPWWPGRVCAINATETADGIILDHIADVDWYCSPTKSHLPCSQLWPFLDEYEKRFDKKKKSSGYKKAISEAKYDAVLNAQYLESLIDEESPGIPSSFGQDNTNPAPSLQTSTNKSTRQDYCSANKELSSQHGNSGSSLVNAFIRGAGDEKNSNKVDNSIPTSIPVSGYSYQNTSLTSDMSSNSAEADYHTIFVPSPLTLLDNT